MIAKVVLIIVLEITLVKKNATFLNVITITWIVFRIMMNVQSLVQIHILEMEGVT
jgi:hypothetical protein